MKNKKWFLLILLLACSSLMTCENPVIDKWWVPDDKEPEYTALIKNIPIKEQADIIIDHEFITEYVYETIIKEIEKIITVEGPTEVKIVEVLKSLTEEEIIELFQNLEPEKVLKILTVTQYNYLVKELVITIDSEQINLGDAYVLIKKIPRKYIYDFLTPDQRETVVMQMKPEILLKYLEIERIEYIIFQENTDNFTTPINENNPSGLTAEEVSYNMRIVTDMAKYIKQLYSISDPRILLIHGHAHPSETSPTTLSEARANAVYAEIVRINGGGGTGTQWPLGKGVNVISLRWFGGDKSLYRIGGPYEKLNRRVEVMFYKSLQWIDWKGGGTVPPIQP